MNPPSRSCRTSTWHATPFSARPFVLSGLERLVSALALSSPTESLRPALEVAPSCFGDNGKFLASSMSTVIALQAGVPSAVLNTSSSCSSVFIGVARFVSAVVTTRSMLRARCVTRLTSPSIAARTSSRPDFGHAIRLFDLRRDIVAQLIPDWGRREAVPSERTAPVAAVVAFRPTRTVPKLSKRSAQSQRDPATYKAAVMAITKRPYLPFCSAGCSHSTRGKRQTGAKSAFCTQRVRIESSIFRIVVPRAGASPLGAVPGRGRILLWHPRLGPLPNRPESRSAANFMWRVSIRPR